MVESLVSVAFWIAIVIVSLKVIKDRINPQ
jgi:hypothetical protein